MVVFQRLRTFQLPSKIVLTCFTNCLNPAIWKGTYCSARLLGGGVAHPLICHPMLQEYLARARAFINISLPVSKLRPDVLKIPSNSA